MKTVSCPLCHIMMTEMSSIVESGKKQLSDDQLKLYKPTGYEQYHLDIDAGLPTHRRLIFLECLGCGFVAMFNEEKLK